MGSWWQSTARHKHHNFQEHTTAWLWHSADMNITWTLQSYLSNEWSCILFNKGVCVLPLGPSCVAATEAPNASTGVLNFWHVALQMPGAMLAPRLPSRCWDTHLLPLEFERRKTSHLCYAFFMNLHKWCPQSTVDETQVPTQQMKVAFKERPDLIQCRFFAIQLL